MPQTPNLMCMRNIAKGILRLSLFILCVSSCRPAAVPMATAVPQPTFIVTRTVLESVELVATPVVCMPPAEGIEIVVEPTSPTSAKIELAGLQAGESITLLFTAKPTMTQTSEIEISLLEGVATDGRFSYEMRGLTPLSDSEENVWTVKAIHAHGVVCHTFVLP